MFVNIEMLFLFFFFFYVIIVRYRFLCTVKKYLKKCFLLDERFNALFEAKEFRVILFARFTSIFFGTAMVPIVVSKELPPFMIQQTKVRHETSKKK